MTPELFDPRSGRPVDTATVVAAIRSLAPGHQGVTLSGGEPFQQPLPLSRVLRELHASTDLDAMAFSGYTLEEIHDLGPDASALLSELDLLVDGRYLEDSPTDRVWRGSANQRLHLLSERAQRYASLREAFYPKRRPMQTWVGPDGRCLVLGIPGRQFWRGLRAATRRRGLDLRRAPLESVR